MRIWKMTTLSLGIITLTGARTLGNSSPFHREVSDTQAVMAKHCGFHDARERAIARAIVREAHKGGFDPRYVLSVIITESNCYPAARNRKSGARGLMQLKPSTAKGVASETGIEVRSSTALDDPVVNVKLGSSYLKQMHDRFRNTERALTAYCHGPHARRTSPHYARKVLRTYHRLTQDQHRRTHG